VACVSEGAQSVAHRRAAHHGIRIKAVLASKESIAPSGARLAHIYSSKERNRLFSEEHAHTKGTADRNTVGRNLAMAIRVESPAFQSGDRIPTQYTADGADRSPELRWSGAPASTREYALVCDDPDAPTEQPWVHWVLYGLSSDTVSLPAGLSADARLTQPISAMQGKNSWPSGRTSGYRGPAPPPGHGVHHYHFRLYALDARLDLGPGLEKRSLLAAIEGHVVDEGELIGTFER